MRKSIPPLALLVLLSFPMGACLDALGPTDTETTTEEIIFDVQPGDATIAVGETLQLEAKARGSGAKASAASKSVIWSSSAPNVAQVSDRGMVTGMRPGAATIHAMAKGNSGKKQGQAANITVVAPSVASVAILPRTATLTTGESLRLSALVITTGGDTLTNRSVAWTSSDPTVAAVDANGQVTAVAIGTASITASAEGKSGSASITVTEQTTQTVGSVSVVPNSAQLNIGRSLQLSAVALSSTGDTLRDRSISWSSANPAVAAVTSSGLVTALSAGNATITATAEGKSGSASITVVAEQTGGSPQPGLNDAIIFEDGFERGNLSAWDGTDGDAGKYSVTSDLARVHTGSYALEGVMSPNSSWGELNKWYMPGYDEAYVAFDVLFEEGFQNLRGDGGGMHFFAQMGNRVDNMWSASGKAGTKPNGSDFFLSILDPEEVWANSALRPFTFYTYFPDMSCDGGCWGDRFYQTPPAADLLPGQWYHVVFYIKTNTPGQKDGSQALWIDGVKKIDAQNMRWRDTEDLRLNQISVQMYMPNAPKTQHIWIDNVVVWTPN